MSIDLSFRKKSSLQITTREKQILFGAGQHHNFVARYRVNMARRRS